MDILTWPTKAMSMDDTSWRRHANPWSVYARFMSLPLISLAFYSREWIGAFAFLPIILALLWGWINPRMFSIPKFTDHWASMATFGERIYLNRNTAVIPSYHLAITQRLIRLSLYGTVPWLYGVYALDGWALIFANLWIMIFKAWFLDRMVWLYMDMKDTNSVYQSWFKQAK